MNFIVQKFGGTSLSSDDLRAKAAAKIAGARQEGYVPVVVVSAIGRLGDPYATDTLLSFAQDSGNELPPRESDLLMHCGEIISGVIMAAAIQKTGCPAVFLTGAQAGIITDSSFNNARILRINPENIIRHAREGKVVVVAGFQGVTAEGEVTTLGRGGSDTTAAALGVALDAAQIDIYTDVDGIMTADPRIVNDARPLDVVTYNEICQLAHEGAKVIHPRAVEIAMQKGIPLRIKCTFSDAPGTLVTSREEVFKGAIDITSDRTITGITHIQDITRIKVVTKDAGDVPDFQKRIFKAMALAGISVDFINVHPEAVFFTVKNTVAAKAVQILVNMGICPEVLPDCAKVAAVGAAMTGVPGVMAKIVEALAEEGIQILQSADSYTTIWVLVKMEDAGKSIRALHEKFSREM
ncbi:aspartate kinase [Pelotomaculum propionicicum]|uniref:Aspartokinase n=1 Tax=Pelotomaculum propionicicum TaxID=258475 RepID=A0A4Y7RM77_9FIRM|nr:aspartate kinase [Pelotomaculum propionicicum]NLI12643.1 aspartate kinase [Peptococcaceae bacterium]TEB09782.1 Aspartokinase [Pelotomaculum propionicicum]